MKKCSRCGEEYPNTDEFFYKSKDYKDGLKRICSECERAYARERHIRKKEELNRKSKEYYQKNIEEQRRKCREYYNRNKKMFKEKHKRYWEENKDKIINKHREWLNNNKERIRINAQKRRSKKKKLPSTLTEEDWDYALDFFENRCCYCGKKTFLTQDHFVPANDGGGYVPENIVPACLSCNSKKRISSFHEWYETTEFYSEERKEKILVFLESRFDELLTKGYNELIK